MPPGRAILASNHASFFDPPILAACFSEQIVFLAKPILFKGFLGIGIRALNAHPIGSDSLKFCLKELKADKKVLIFPEGHRSHEGDLMPFMPGASLLADKSQSPIIPIKIKGAYEAWPRKNKWPRFFESISVICGDPIFPSTFEHLPKKERLETITQALFNAIQAL